MNVHTCTRCGQTKPLSEFYDRPSKSWCRQCSRTYVMDWRKNNPEKHKAHRVFQGAIRRGEVKAAARCSRCGTKTTTVAHHEDYSKPLDVVWLCDACHARRHWEIKRTKTLTEAIVIGLHGDGTRPKAKASPPKR